MAKQHPMGRLIQLMGIIIALISSSENDVLFVEEL
jgi:hypothetical protein